MQNSHGPLIRCFLIASLALLFLCALEDRTDVDAQQAASSVTEERDRGIQLYQQGNAKGAIETLRAAVRKNKDDGEAWHYLGRAFLLKGDKNEARKPFEQAANVRLSDVATFWPLPRYTEEARQSHVSGTITLRAILGADGRVHAVNVISGLPDGLTRVAVLCALRIKFIPATKDGKPVSQWTELLYGFNLY